MGKPEKNSSHTSDAASESQADAAQPYSPDPSADPGGQQSAPPLEIRSEALLAGRTEVRIRHRGEIYRLTLTRAGKLILHK